MSIGWAGSSADLNSEASGLAAVLAVTYASIDRLQSFVVNTGLAGLEAAGFSTTDAQSFTNLVNYLSTLSGLYKGTATQASPFSFQNALALLTGPPPDTITTPT